MKLTIPDHIAAIKPYVAGKPLEELEREYGITDSVKIASNENPLGPSPKALAAMQEALPNLHRYPDAGGYYLIRKLAERLRVPPETVVIGNGSDEIIELLARGLLTKRDEVILHRPCFLMYEIVVRAVGAQPVFVPLEDMQVDLDRIADRITDRTRLIYVTNPNNPTGGAFSQAALQAFLAKVPPEVVVVVDEAYIEFATDPECAQSLSLYDSERALVTLRTFSKAYGLAGLRIGYGVMPPNLAALLNRIRQPFNTNNLAQIGACAALDDHEFLERTLQVVHDGLAYLRAALNKRGIAHFPTQTNFFLIDVKQSADAIFENMLHQGVIVRPMTSYGYPQFIRVNVGLPEENKWFVRALDKVL